MTLSLALLAYALLPLIGVHVLRLAEVRRLPRDGQLAVSWAMGALTLAVLMSGLSLVRIEWSRATLFVAAALVVAVGLIAMRRSAGVSLTSGERESSRRLAVFGIAVVLAVFVYALLSARITIGDLLFFWGPKGIHFHRTGGIDVEYLRDWDHFLQHRDYPPVLPLLFAWSRMFSSEFSWWGALLLSAICVGVIVMMLRGFTRDARPALLAVAVLAWCISAAWAGGGADVLLLVFECLAVCALVFVRDPHAQTVLAGAGLAGAALTKVEGASFVAIVAVAMVVERIPWRRIARILFAPAALLGAWLIFVVAAGLLDSYRGPGRFSLQYLDGVLRGTFREAAYEAFWLPWIAPLLVVALGNFRRARLPLVVAVLNVAAALYFYLKSPTDPTVFWIPSSADRVFLTPVLMLLIAAAAAHSEEKIPAAPEAQRGLEPA
jgi:hypothetical protein